MPKIISYSDLKQKDFAFYAKLVVAAFASVFLLGNILYAIFSVKVQVSRSSYEIIDGFPIFINNKEYVSVLKKYPYKLGVPLKFHTLKLGESIWDITRTYNISIDTLIAANPFLKNLVAHQGSEIVIPAIDGTLVAIDDYFDVYRMEQRFKKHKGLVGEYKPHFFKIISFDDVRFVFFKGVGPVIVNRALKRLFEFRQIFQSPAHGFYTSLYGHRVNPFNIGKKMEFHDGIDIVSRYGAPIHPAREGMVVYTGWRGGYGKTVLVQHNDGYLTLYGHCSRILAKKGDWVKKTTVIGKVGSTGRSTGPHLHFTIWKHGKIVDPILYIW